MKTVFTKNGKVVSVCSSSMGVEFTCTIEGAEKHAVDMSLPVEQGWSFALVDGAPSFEAPPPQPPKLTPLEFKMCFTLTERVAIKNARKTDPVLDAAYEILDDPRLTSVDLSLQSNIDLIDYLKDKSLLTTQRADQVKFGVMQ